MAAALDVSLGSKTENVASTTLTLTTAGVVTAGARVYCFLMWSGAPTLSTFAGGGLTWIIDKQIQSGGFNLAVVSAPAPAGLATTTVLTATFSASTTHGLICAASFSGVPDAVALRTESFGNASGAATANWLTQAMGDNDFGGLALHASCVDSNTSSTPDASAGTELFDITDAAYFGALTVQYQIIGPNTLARGMGVWAVVTGSLSNNSITVIRKDNSTAKASPVGATRYQRMRLRG